MGLGVQRITRTRNMPNPTILSGCLLEELPNQRFSAIGLPSRRARSYTREPGALPQRAPSTSVLAHSLTFHKLVFTRRHPAQAMLAMITLHQEIQAPRSVVTYNADTSIRCAMEWCTNLANVGQTFNLHSILSTAVFSGTILQQSRL